MEREQEAKALAEEKAKTESETGDATIKDPQDDVEMEEEMKEVPPNEAPEFQVRNWFENKREGPILLKLAVTNRQKQRVKVSVTLEAVEGSEINANIPRSEIKTQFFDSDTKAILHLVKIDPRKPWGQFRVKVTSRLLTAGGSIPPPPSYNYNMSSGGSVPIVLHNTYIKPVSTAAATSDNVIVNCPRCQHPNDPITFCDRCGEAIDITLQDDYLAQNGYGNAMH